MASNTLDLSLRLRANADGSLSVIPQTTRNVDLLSNAADRSARSAVNSSQSYRSMALNALDVGSAARAAAGGLSVMALVVSGKGLINYADNLQMIDARIKGATSSTGDFNLANQALVDLSLKTHSTLEGNAQLFARTNKSVEAMGGNVRNTIAFTDILAKSLKISGTATSEQAGLTRQVAQALASGVLRGDEYNSVMENGARFAYALADGLGVNVGTLRAMAEAGALTTDKVFPALLSQAGKLTQEFDALPVSVSAAFNNVETQFGRYIHGANSAHQATSNMAAAVDVFSEHLTPILDGLVVIGEASVLYLVSMAGQSLQSFVIGQVLARQAVQSTAAAMVEQRAIVQAHAEALAMDSGLQVSNTQAQIIATESLRQDTAARVQSAEMQMAQAEATLASTSAMVQNSVVLNARTMAEQQLNAAGQERGAMMIWQSALDEHQLALSAQLTVAEAERRAALQQLTMMQAEQAMTTQSGRNAVMASAQAALHDAEAQLINTTARQATINATRLQASATLQASEAEIVRAQATIAGTSATVQSTSVLYIRQQAEDQLTVATQQRAIVSAELSALEIQQAALSAEVTLATEAQENANRLLTAAQEANAAASSGAATGFRLLLNPMNDLNLAFSLFMGIQIGSWLSEFTVVADAASIYIGAWAHTFEDLGYRAEQAKAVLTGDWSSLDEISAAHERNTQAINDNVNGSIEWRESLEKVGLTEQSYKDMTLSLRTPAEVFKQKTNDITLAFNQGLVPLDKYITRLGELSDEMDRLNTSKLSAFEKKIAELKDEQDKLQLTPQAYQEKQTAKQFKDPVEQALINEQYATIFKLQEQQKAKEDDLKQDKSQTHKAELDAIKAIEKAQKSAADEQLNNIQRIAQAKLYANDQDLKTLEFEYKQANISLSTYLDEKNRLIHAATAIEMQALEKQKQQAVQFADRMDAIHAAIKKIESAGKIDAVSTDGAIGTMQVLPSTLKSPGLGMAGMDVGGLTDSSNRETLKAFAVKYANEIQVFGEEYFDRLLQRYNGNLDKAAAAYNMGFGAFEKAGQKPNNAETIAYVKSFNEALASGSDEQISAASKVAELTDQQVKLLQKEKSELADLGQFAVTETGSHQRAIEELNVKYIELTGTTRAAFLARQKLTNAPLLKQAEQMPDADKNKMLELIDKVSKAEQFKVDTQAASAYQDKLLEINSSTRDMGVTSTEAFDLINKGAGGLSTAFNSLIKSLQDVDDAIVKNGLDAKKTAEDSSLSEIERGNLAQAYAKKSIKLDQQKTAASLTGIRQTTGAFADMFGENTAARQAFHTVEMTLGGIELAYNLANNAEEIASNVGAMASNIATGATKIWSQMGIYAPIGLAVMAASLAAWGAMGAGSHVAEPPKSSPDTGTVLGDSSQQSQSVGNIYELLKDIHASEYPELRGINDGVADLQASLSATITTLFQAGGLDTSNKGINLSYGLSDRLAYSYGTLPGLITNAIGSGVGVLASAAVTAVAGTLTPLAIAGTLTAAAGPIGLAAGLLFSGLNALFSGGYRDVVERGIQTPAQSVGGLTAGSFSAQQYNVVKTREWDLFSDSTRYDTVMTALDTKVVKALGTVFESAGTVAMQLATALGGNLQQKVQDYVIPELKINLTGLNAEDASKKINAVISTTLDTMVTDIFSGTVGQYQQIGEGLLETATRVVAEVAVVKDALHTSGLSLGSDAIAISDALVQAAGGIKEFQTQFSDYYDKFYSDAEKQTRLQANLTDQLGAVFLGLPATRDGYRDLVDALDLNNAKDRERYSLLMQLASAADSYYSALDSGLKTYQDGVVSAYDTAAGLLKGQVDTYRQFVTQLKSFSDQLVMGTLSTANPADKYQTAKTAFLDVKATLATGTDAEKQAALGQLQGVTQTFLEASRGFYTSGSGYIKDFATAQGLLAQEISGSTIKADVAQSQLDKLTEQVTALGLIKTSVDNVETAVNAVGIAISSLQAFQDAQAAAVRETANKAAFANLEDARLAAYNAPINTKAAAYANNGATIQNAGAARGYVNTSQSDFSVAATFNPVTKTNTSDYAGYTGGANGAGVWDTLTQSGGQFERIRNLVSLVAGNVSALVGGSLPDINLTVAKSGTTYSFADKRAFYAGDTVDSMLMGFANDATDYLADQIGDKAWADKIKAVSFSSLAGGLSDLSTLIANLKRPYVAGTYDTKTDYTKIDGSHYNGITRVPFDGYIAELHRNERVLTAQESAAYNTPAPVSLEFPRPAWLDTLLNTAINAPMQKSDNAIVDELKNAIKELQLCRAELAKQTKSSADNAAVDRSGFVQVIDKLQRQIDVLEQANRANARVVRERV